MQHIFPQNHRQNCSRPIAFGADFGPAVMTTRTDGTCDQNSRVILDPYAPGPSPRTAAPWLSPAVLSVPQSTLPWPGAASAQAGMKADGGVKVEPGAYQKGQTQADQASVFGHCQPTAMPDDLMNMNSRRYLQLLDQHPHAAHSNPQAAHPLMPPLGAARFWDMGCYFGSHTPAMAHSSAGVGPHVAPTASRMPGYDSHIIGLGSIATNVLHHPVTASGAAVVDNHHQMPTGLPPPPPAHPAAHAASHHASHLGASHPALAPPPPPPPHVPVCSSAAGSVSVADSSVSSLKFYPGGAASAAAVAASVAASVSHSSEPSGSASASSSGAADNSSVASSRQPQPPQPQQPHPSSAGASQQLSRAPHQPSSASVKRQASSSAASSAAVAAAAASSAAASTGDASGMLAGGAERPFICETCNKGFTKEHHLKTHKRIHTGERPYGCDVCGKAFSKAYHLKRHKSIHTGERPFVCEDCGKAFSEAYYLKRHRSIHSGERPHACESCGKSFSKAYYLKRHQTIHTGERRQFYNMWSKGGAAAVSGGPSTASGSGTPAGGPTDPGASNGSPLGRKPTMAVPLSLVGASASASNDVSAGQRPV